MLSSTLSFSRNVARSRASDAPSTSSPAKKRKRLSGLLLEDTPSSNERYPAKNLAASSTKKKRRTGEHQSAVSATAVEEADRSDNRSPSSVGVLDLPVEIIHHILSFLGDEVVFQINRVCTDWRGIAEDESYWQRRFRDHFGIPPKLRLTWRQRFMQFLKRSPSAARGLEKRLRWAASEGFEEYFARLLKSSTGVAAISHLGDLMVLVGAEGNKRILQTLLEGNASVNTTDKFGQTPLFAAAKTGKREAVEMLLRQPSILVDYPNKRSRTPLMAASQNGYTSTVRALLANGANPDKIDRFQSTALTLAAENGHLEITQMLLDIGAGVDASTEFGCTALMFAAKRGHADVVQALLLHKASINMSTHKSHHTAMMFAAESGHLPIVKLLVEAGANKHAVNRHSQNALMLATAKGQERVAKYLQASGCEMLFK